MAKRAMKTLAHGCPSGNWATQSVRPTGKPTVPRLSDMTFVEPWFATKKRQLTRNGFPYEFRVKMLQVQLAALKTKHAIPINLEFLAKEWASGTLINYEHWFLWVAVAIAHLPHSGYTEGWSSFGITSPNQLPGRKGATLFPPVTKQMCGFRARKQQQQQKRSLGVKLWTEWHEFTTTAPGYMETVWGKCVNEIAWNTTTNNHVTLLLLWTVLFVPHAANL